jgi:hypothetical protein
MYRNTIVHKARRLYMYQISDNLTLYENHGSIFDHQCQFCGAHHFAKEKIQKRNRTTTTINTTIAANKDVHIIINKFYNHN